TQLSWSADSMRLLIRDSRDGHAEAWISDPRGAVHAVLPGQAVAGAAFFADGSGLAIAGDAGAPSGLVAIDSDATGDQFTALLPTGEGLTPAFAPHGSAVALLADGAPVRLLAKRGQAPAGVGRAATSFSWAPD